MLRDADAVAARRVHHEDAARARRFEVDVVDAGAGTGNHPKTRRPGKQIGVDFRRAADDERIRLFERGREDVGLTPGLRVDRPARNGRQQFDGGCGQLIGDDDVHEGSEESVQI